VIITTRSSKSSTITLLTIMQVESMRVRGLSWKKIGSRFGKSGQWMRDNYSRRGLDNIKVGRMLGRLRG